MSSPRYRIVRRCRKGQQHIPTDIAMTHLPCPRDLKRRVTVMQKRHIIRAQSLRNSRRPFVPRRADGVKPLPHPLHITAGAVKRAAQTRGAENCTRALGPQRACGRGTGWKITGRHPCQKVFMHDIGAVHRLPLWSFKDVQKNACSPVTARPKISA
jgi:hypothetical protein